MYNYSNVRVVNASSLKCNNIAVSYFLSEKAAKLMGCKSISLGASVSNPFTIASKDFKGRIRKLRQELNHRPALIHLILM